MMRKVQPDKWLFMAATGLALFGVLMVYSASAVLALQQNGSEYHYFVKQLIWTSAGLIAMLVAMCVDYRRLRDPRVVYGALAVCALLLCAVFLFPRVNGAHRWIKLAGFSGQPSELAKLTLAIFLAYFFERRCREIDSFWLTFLPAGAVTAGFALLVLIEPDLGTALMLGVMFVAVAFVAGTRLSHLAIAAAPAFTVVLGMLLLVPWRLARMMAFVNPWADPQGKSYQVVQSLYAVGSGGIYGLGFAQGKQKLFYLPFAHSDFIFAVVGEELGLIGCIALLLVFALFLWRGLHAALHAPDRFGMLLGTCIVVGIVVQALFNMSVVLSLAPTKGIPLPFVSYGGSSLLPTLFAVGILLNISQHAPAPPLRGED